MKISEQPTSHILVRAHCDSEWDCCDFAIIDCGKGWAEEIAQRLDTARHLHENPGFFSTRYLDCSASFYSSTDDETDDELPKDKDWAFVELEEGEEETFDEPESYLDMYTLTLYQDGSGRYMASGKYTNEDFYTENLPFAEIIASMQ
jgi:hypothetical protein